jgi:hypothetical protein
MAPASFFNACCFEIFDAGSWALLAAALVRRHALAARLVAVCARRRAGQVRRPRRAHVRDVARRLFLGGALAAEGRSLRLRPVTNFA